jgi:hypothetical protein
MKRSFALALLLPAVALIGCAVTPGSPTGPTGPTSGNWTNWQIQAGTAITSPPNTYPSFLGAIQIQGTQAAGIFTTVNSTGSSAGLDYSGSYATTTGDVTLSTDGYGFEYTQPATPYTLVPVSVVGGCVYPPGYTGPECNAIFSSPSVGIEIAPLNGTYTGTLTESAVPSMSGTGTLTLTQSDTPNSSGAFPLTASIAFPSASALGTFNLAGTVSGESIALNFCSAAVIGPCIPLTASTNPAGTQITISNLGWNQTGPSYTFTGVLTLQPPLTPATNR